MTKRLTSILLAAIVVLVPGLASANNHDDKGFYIGAGAHVTGAEANLRKTFVNLAASGTGISGMLNSTPVAGASTAFTFPALNVTVTSDEDSDVGYGVHAGYKINKFFAVEVGYSELGEFTGQDVQVIPAGFPTIPVAVGGASTDVDIAGATLVMKGAFDVSALSAAVLGTYPLADNANVFGRLGYYTTDLSQALTFSISEGATTAANGALALSQPLFDDASGIMYGAGLEVNFGRNHNILVRGEFNVLSDGFGEVEDITQFGLTASWMF